MTPTIIRKLAFLCFRRMLLGDRIRNFSYAWAWRHVKRIPLHSQVLDIGSGESLLPALLACLGYQVVSVERNGTYAAKQAFIMNDWGKRFEVLNCDFLLLPHTAQYDCIMSILALEHSGNADIAVYARAAQKLAPGGVIITVNEYSPDATEWKRARPDGDRYVYGPGDLQARIIAPLEKEGAGIREIRFANANFDRGTIHSCKNGPKANLVFICAQKNRAGS